MIVRVSQGLFDEELKRVDGAGGSGPAGGGGGEGVQFLRLAPSAAPPVGAAVVKVPTLSVAPTVILPVPPPIVPPVTSQARPQSVLPTQEQPASGTASEGASTSGGNGNGVGVGAGPGSGGGVGSGEGSGRGSATGAGTGGGAAKNYPPTPKAFFLPPLPAPARVRGFHLIAWFDVDSTGKATLLRFTPTPDEGYNVRLRATLLALKFRPAVRPDGTPMRDTVNVELTF